VDEHEDIEDLHEVFGDVASISKRLKIIMALLDQAFAELAAVATEAQGATDRVSADLAAVAQARDAAVAQVTDLQAQVVSLQAMAVTQEELDALSAQIAAVLAAVQAIDPAPAV
jgi:hypothetical protein